MNLRKRRRIDYNFCDYNASYLCKLANDLFKIIIEYSDGRMLMNLIKVNRYIRNNIIELKHNDIKNRILRLESSDNPKQILQFLKIFPIQNIEVDVNYILPEIFYREDKTVNNVNKIKIFNSNDADVRPYTWKIIDIVNKLSKLLWYNNNCIEDPCIEIIGKVSIELLREISCYYAIRFEINHIILYNNSDITFVVNPLINSDTINNLCAKVKTLTLSQTKSDVADYGTGYFLRKFTSIRCLNLMIPASAIIGWRIMLSMQKAYRNFEQVWKYFHKIRFDITLPTTNYLIEDYSFKNSFEYNIPQHRIFCLDSEVKTLKFTNLICNTMQFLTRFVDDLTKLKLVFAPSNPTIQVKLKFFGINIGQKLRSLKIKKLVIVDTHNFSYLVSSQQQWLWLNYLFFLLPNVSELHYIHLKSLNLELDNILINEEIYKTIFAELEDNLYQYIDYEKFGSLINKISIKTTTHKQNFLRTIFCRS